VIRRALLVLVALALMACGVALSGRIEVGEHVGEPEAARPCP
jgi:hypothetical protein